MELNDKVLENNIYDRKEFILDIIEKLRIKKIENISSSLSVNPTFTITRYTSNGETTDCGKGLTIRDAFYSGIFESIERYSAENYDDIKYEGSTFAVKKIYNVCAPSDIYPVKNYADKLSLTWCEGINLLTNKPILIPIEGKFSNINTVGLASGSSNENAIVHAIYELIEHDTLSMYSYAGLQGRKIKLIEEDGELFNIYSSLIEKGISVDIRLLDNDLKIPMVLVLFNDIPLMQNVKIAGMGSNFDIKIAVKRALLECQQSADYWYSRYKLNDMDEKGIIHPSLELYNKYRISDKFVYFSDIEIIDIKKKKEELNLLLEKLCNVTDKVIVVNITNNKLNIPCVKVIIPEFENTLEDHYIKGRCKLFEKVINEHTRGRV